MKKLLLIILSLVTLLSFTACNNNAVVYNPEKPYWLDEKDFGNKVVTVNETAVYNITYKPFESPNENVICEFADNNTFTMTVVDTELDGVKCYLMTSTCIVSGSYTATANSEKVEFTDTTVNKTWFTWNSGFEFIKSEQEAESTLPTNLTASPDKHGNRFIKIKYKTVVVYGDKNAESTFTITGENKETLANYFSLDDGETHTFKKYNKGNYIDSNMLFFAVRTFNFAEDLNYSFSSIDVLNTAKHSLALSASEVTTISPKGYGIKLHSIPTVQENAEIYKMKISIDETYSGNSITCSYFSETERWHHALFSMESPLPYKLGTLVYTLTSLSF